MHTRRQRVNSPMTISRLIFSIFFLLSVLTASVSDAETATERPKLHLETQTATARAKLRLASRASHNVEPSFFAGLTSGGQRGPECDETRRPIYVFLHALKSGGTLMSTILRALNVSTACLGSSSIGKLQPNSKSNWDDEDHCRFAYFHEDVSVANVIAKKTQRCLQFMTLVRDPVELRQALFRTYTVGLKQVRLHNMTEEESDQWVHRHFPEYIQNHTKAAAMEAAAAAAHVVKVVAGESLSKNEKIAVAQAEKRAAVWGPNAEVKFWNEWKDSYPPQTTYLQNMLLGLGVGGGGRDSPFRSHFAVTERKALYDMSPAERLSRASAKASSFFFVGLTTRYTDAMCLLAYCLREPELPYLQHVSRHHPDDTARLSTEWAIPADLYRATLRLAGPDAALYDHIEKLFETRLSAMQLEVQQALLRLTTLRDGTASWRGSAGTFAANATNDLLLRRITRNQWCINSKLFEGFG